jgi:predicted extracellular nuclease
MRSPASRRRAGAIAAVVALGAASLTLAPAPASAAPSPDIVISEVYGGGGNTGATLRNDFIELYNRGAETVTVDGWTVQYASAAGSTWATTALDGVIPPGRSYLVQEAAGAGGTVDLPPPDATGSIAMSATSGKVALVTATTPLTCATDCATQPGVRDFVGYGAASSAEGSPAPALTNTTSASRNAAGDDTDNNLADFTVGAPTPSSCGADCVGPPPEPQPSATIDEIQGGGHRSPLAGTTVTDVLGIVTAISSNGFWFQQEAADADPATSEGMFVFTNTGPTVAAGDRVAVDGRVTEFRPGGSTSANLTTTELSGPSVTVLSSGNALPPPVLIGPGGRVPPTAVIDDDATGDVETSGSFDATADGIDFYESLEGMRLRLDDPVAVGPTNAFGEVPVLAANGTGAGVRTNRGGIVIQSTDFNPERVVIDDTIIGAGAMPVVDAGDGFAGAVVGVLDYSFGNFKLLVTNPPTAVDRTLAREATVPQALRELAVATFNVENLDPTDSPAKFAALANQIVTNLRAPDIIAIEEIQDNDGPADTGTVDASETWQLLIAAIAAAGGPAYDWRSIDPVNNQDGGEPGGNIRVGFLFRTDNDDLEFVDRPGGDATTPVEVLRAGQKARLSISPGRIDPANPAFTASRKPLAGEFRFRGETVFVVANHWVSKGGDNPLFGRFQPPVRSSETQRLAQAQAVAAFVGQIFRIDRNAFVVVAGDLNDFEFSAAASAVTAAGMADLPATLPLPERYTYVFDGNSQVLDHIMVSPSFFKRSFAYDVVHVNSEFADQVSDHEPQVARIRVE